MEMGEMDENFPMIWYCPPGIMLHRVLSKNSDHIVEELSIYI